MEETLEPVQTSAPPGTSEPAELKDEIAFLKNSVAGLEMEVCELRHIMFSNKAVYKDLLKSYVDLKKSAEKQSAKFNTELERQKEKIQQLQNELSESRRSKEDRRQ